MFKNWNTFDYICVVWTFFVAHTFYMQPSTIDEYYTLWLIGHSTQIIILFIFGCSSILYKKMEEI